MMRLATASLATLLHLACTSSIADPGPRAASGSARGSGSGSGSATRLPLGATCHRQTDCDVACTCDRRLVHHDGQTGVTGTCEDHLPKRVWLCTLDAAGRVASLIID